jgi:hypothetical protein
MGPHLQVSHTVYARPEVNGSPDLRSRVNCFLQRSRIVGFPVALRVERVGIE